MHGNGILDPEAWLNAINPRGEHLLDFSSTDRHYCAVHLASARAIRVHIQLIEKGRKLQGPVFAEIVGTAKSSECCEGAAPISPPDVQVTALQSAAIIAVKMPSQFLGGLKLKIHYGPAEDDFAECNAFLQ